MTCEWGLPGLRESARGETAVVIVDVLSFSTAVDIAVSRGASVYPFSGDRGALADFAASVEAVAGGPRGESRFSLSPASFLHVVPGTRVALRSINGGRLSEAAASRLVVAGCLRNARAIAEAVSTADDVALVPAGEQWSDGALRPCIEDWLGAGAIAAHLRGDRSAEAEVATRTFESVRAGLRELLRESVSGRQLVGLGFGSDVDLAADLDVSDAVPVLIEGAYVGWRGEGSRRRRAT